MNQPTIPTGPGEIPGVINLSPEPIISRGFTLCPKCGQKTKALWTKTTPRDRDPLGPKKYFRSGNFSPDLPETVSMRFNCECGESGNRIVFSDARFFYASGPGNDCGENCACRASNGELAAPLGSNATGQSGPFPTNDHFAKLSPCVVLIEIERGCNLACPTCSATSPKKTNEGQFIPLGEFKTRVQGIIDRRGQDIEILQLSGGEATLHPDFFEILKWCQDNQQIHVVMINTNGLKLLDPSFASRLKSVADRNKLHLYLKFNGDNEEAQHSLVGFNYHPTELKCLDVVADLDIATTLAMTVTPMNLSQVWPVARLGLGIRSIRGVNYQPRFGGGRIEEAYGSLVDAGHVINHLIYQGQPHLTEKSILPLPCGDPNCQHIGMIHRGTLTCFGSAMTAEQRMKLLEFLADKINYSKKDLSQCGCEVTDFGRLVHDLENTGQMFRLSIKPFMTFGGAWHNWSCSRTDQCCTSVVGKDGSLHSYCRTYNGRDGNGVIW